MSACEREPAELAETNIQLCVPEAIGVIVKQQHIALAKYVPGTVQGFHREPWRVGVLIVLRFFADHPQTVRICFDMKP